MNKSWLVFGVSAVTLTGSIAGAIAFTAQSDAAATKEADAQATRAEKLLWQGKTQQAVAALESAVSLCPEQASYRALLGQAYMKDGRFSSARQAFQEALVLDPSNGRAALSLALALVATGDWNGAHKTLDEHATTIPARDRGLALALAGDPGAAVELLTAAARAPDADAKTRQNLALSLALAGRWPEAKTVAAVDLPPDQVDARIMEWARFAKPNGAADQVATLLGVKPVQDAGEPTRLALAAPVAAPTMVAVAHPAAAPAPVPSASPAAPVLTAAAERSWPIVAATSVPAVAPQPAAVVVARPVKVAPRPVATPPVVAAISAPAVAPQPMIAAPSHATKIALRPVVAPARVAVASQPVRKPAGTTANVAAKQGLGHGHYYVQLGAYSNEAEAHAAWNRVHRRFAAFRHQAPAGATVKVKGVSYYRLSVGGFSRGEASGLCRSWHSSGGRCFVRTEAGDQLASWAQPGAPKLATQQSTKPKVATRKSKRQLASR